MDLLNEIPEPRFTYPTDWPPREYHTNPKDITVDELQNLVDLIEQDAGETEIDSQIAKKISLLTLLMAHPDYSTGHHNSWVIPKKAIKTRKDSLDKGEIPDYLMGGSDSDGYNWFVVELKGANTNIFTETKKQIYFSNLANKGLNQLMEYLLTLDRDQG